MHRAHRTQRARHKLREATAEELKGRVIGGGRKKSSAPAASDGVADGFAFVTAEIFDDDDVAGLELWNESLLDISREALAVD
jgi:hypothetical protein